MAWLTPITHAVGDPITVSDWNTYTRDNTNWLYGDYAWQTVGSFTNGWSAGSPAPQYRRAGNIVTLRGLLTGGTNNAYGYIMPTAYCPSSNLLIACVANNGAYCSVGVAITGAVTPALSGGEVGVYTDSVSFDVRA